jgi:hypothetical protein
LAQAGIRAEILYSGCHVVVEVNGVVVDVTATQFDDVDPVFTEPKSRYLRRRWLVGAKSLGCVEQLRRVQRDDGWWPDQMA